MSSVVADALELRDVIRGLVSGAPESCDFEWRSLPEPSKGPVAYSVEDGGQGDRKLRTYTLFAVKAWGANFSDNGQFNSVQEGFVGLVVPQGLEPGQRLRLYRQVLELDVSAKSVARGGIALFDGTPPMRWGRVGTEVTWGESLELAARLLGSHSEALKGLTQGTCTEPDVECVLDLISNASRRPLTARALLRLAAQGGLDLNSGNGRKIIYSVLAMENLERLYLFKSVVERAWSQNSIPVFVVKTSRSTSFCNRNLPDIHVIESALRAKGNLEPGYTVANVYNSIYDYFGLKESGRSMYPDVGDLREFYENRLSVVTAFVRLRRGGYIFKVEVVYDRRAQGYEQVLREALSKLSAIPLTAEGYPLPLLMADSKARVTSAEMDAALRAVSLDLVPESRSVLRV
jgi:hypothetical protein